MQRLDATFPAGDSYCSAWLFRPDGAAEPVPCVVMAHGLSLTRHEALSLYAERFAAAGLAVLVFDYRPFGDSVRPAASIYLSSRPGGQTAWRRCWRLRRSSTGCS